MNINFDYWIENKWVQNCFMWLALFLILVTSIQAENRLYTSFVAILILMPVVYINNILILPYLRKNILLFIPLFLGNVILYTLIVVYMIKTVSDESLQSSAFINFFGILVLAMICSSSIKLARDSFLRKQKEQEAELQLLKAQLNPHFLFNTLNNLYGLSVIKSEKLPDLMLQLSNLLRYSLYETKETTVPLEKEIKYLQNYISLEKIRLEKTAAISIDLKGDFHNIKIAPMLFIVFVENAFKHLHISTNVPSVVSVSLDCTADQLRFKCINNSSLQDERDQNIEKKGQGIGLQNVKKRLSILYHNKHDLQIDQSDDLYKVQLVIDL